jgi:hypothetical protein
MLVEVDLSHPNFDNFFTRICESHFNDKDDHVIDRHRNDDSTGLRIWVGAPDCIMRVIISD